MNSVRLPRHPPPAWEMLVWNNGLGVLTIWEPRTRDSCRAIDVPDLAVYGRYAAIKYASGDLIYVQDDDCVVSDPQAIVREYEIRRNDNRFGIPPLIIVSNMPPEFRHDFYTDHCLVGFGAVFHRDAPGRAFEQLVRHDKQPFYRAGWTDEDIDAWVAWDPSLFFRTCDIVFTMLTPRVLVDVPYTNLPHATDDLRMYRQREHVGERQRMRDLVRKVRDA